MARSLHDTILTYIISYNITSNYVISNSGAGVPLRRPSQYRRTRLGEARSRTFLAACAASSAAFNRVAFAFAVPLASPSAALDAFATGGPPASGAAEAFAAP